MLQKFQQYIAKNFSFLNDKKLLIAISGGVDSVVLTHLFYQLKVKISLAHCNFQLRGKESDLDEEFVKLLSKNIDAEIFITHFKTEEFAKKHKQSIQLSARNLRYQWFQKLISKHYFDYILTAHHLNDNLETFLINFTRGTGLEGLTGIPPINGTIIRPLLAFSREEILDYAKKNTLKWREDKSNASTKYLRNKIRHQIVPILKEINPNLLQTFEKTVKNLNESQQIIDDRIVTIHSEIFKNKTKNHIEIPIKKIQKLSNPKAYLYETLKEFGFTEWNDVYNLLTSQSGKQVFSKTHRLLKNRDYLLLSKIDKKRFDISFLIEKNDAQITHPIPLQFKNVEQQLIENKNTIYVDKTLLQFPLTLRKWQNGDYFYPSGMNGKKKISKYFKDEKLSLLEKEGIWLLCSSKNEIIWVVGKRQDNRFLVTKSTITILKIANELYRLLKVF